MEIYMGVAVFLISTAWKPFLYSQLPLDYTCTGETVPVLGKLMVRVVKDEASRTLLLLVVKGGSTTLPGQDWLQELRVDWKAILSLQATLSLQRILVRSGCSQIHAY